MELMMGKRSRAKKEAKAEPHPTLFVLDGAIQNYDGSMLELNTQIDEEGWKEIVIGTIQYFIFLDCLKTIACPILKEEWTKEDDWYRLMLEVNIGRMKNLDPLYIISIDQDKIRKAFEAKIKANAAEVVEDIKRIRAQQEGFMSDHTRTHVSEL